MILKLVIFAGISALVYLSIAIGLIASQTPKVPESAKVSDKGLDFSAAVGTGYSTMPASIYFTARDGTKLAYRSYENVGATDRVIILVHGSGWHGMQFHGMAEQLTKAGVGDVIVPDLRGHGFGQVRRGDIDHISQLEEDMADLIGHLKAQSVNVPKVVLGGHSSGGGFVIRFLGGSHGRMADEVLLLSPFIRHDAPTMRPNSGGWAFTAVRRIIGIVMLNNVGIRVFNHLPVIAFNMPKPVLDGAYGASATLHYSFALNTGMAPRSDYEADLAKIRQPLLLVTGSEDEAFIAEQFEPLISRTVASGRYAIVDGASHLGLVTDDRTVDLIGKWLAER